MAMTRALSRDRSPLQKAFASRMRSRDSSLSAISLGRYCNWTPGLSTSIQTGVLRSSLRSRAWKLSTNRHDRSSRMREAICVASAAPRNDLPPVSRANPESAFSASLNRARAAWKSGVRPAPPWVRAATAGVRPRPWTVYRRTPFSVARSIDCWNSET